MAALNHAVAVAMVRGPLVGLDMIAALATDSRLAQDHRLHSVRAHLLERSGDAVAARAAYLAAADRATSPPVRRHLHARAARLPAPE